jgi:hypothetical protein
MGRLHAFVTALAVTAALGGYPHEAQAETEVPPSHVALAPTFSRAALDRIGHYIRNEVATGTIPGAI